MKKIFQKSTSIILLASILLPSISINYTPIYAQESAQHSTNGIEKISGLSITASHISYPTWDDSNKNEPPKLTINLGLTISELYENGGIIKIPLPTEPQSAQWTEKYGPFFRFDYTNHPIIKQVDTQSEPGTIKILLKAKNEEGFSNGLVSIPLHFSFNEQYKRKIPNNTNLWTVVPSVFLDEQKIPLNINAVKIQSNSRFNPSSSIQTFNPINPKAYRGGSIYNRYRHHADFATQIYLDRNYDNKHIVQIPHGSTFSHTYYTFDKTVEVAGVQYDQYIHRLNLSADNNITSADFNVWNYSNADSFFAQHDFSFTPPDNLQTVGSNFKIRIGIDYKIINQGIINKFNETNYSTVQPAVWELLLSGVHHTGGSIHAISSTQAGSISQAYMNTLGYHYSHVGMTKNTGVETIKNVRYEFFQTSGGIQDFTRNESVKANFHDIILYAERDSRYPWTQYKYSFEVTNTHKTSTSTDDTIRAITTQSEILVPSVGSSARFNLVLPQLEDGEYISKVIIVPMGQDGNSEGNLTPHNGFRTQYRHKAWGTQHWPDGTPVGSTSEAKVKWQLQYLDNPNKPAASIPGSGNIKTFDAPTVSLFYAGVPYAQAQATSKGDLVKSGDIVEYNILGYNNVTRTVSNWENPIVFLRVPAFASIENTNNISLNLLHNNTIGTSKISVTETYRDENYAYYAFRLENTSIPRFSLANPAFSFPVRFVINQGVHAGEYPIHVYTSQADSINAGKLSWGILNDTSDGTTKAKLGLPENGNYIRINNYTHSPIRILKQSEASVSTTIKNLATNGKFSPASLVPAESNEDVTIRLSIENKGTTDLEKIRLYNILPYNGDPLLSEGIIQLKEIISNKIGAIIKTTSTPVEELTKYGDHNTENTPDIDLQSGTLKGQWTNGIPSDPSGLTAFFIDYNNIRLLPGEILHTDLIFRIPDKVSQTVFNQFRYSAIESGNPNVKFNLNSLKAGFSTEYQDIEPPVITLVGQSNIALTVGETFVDEGATWTDNIDNKGKITKGTIVSFNDSHTNIPESVAQTGKYILEYTYTDHAGNPGNTVQRTVIIQSVDKSELKQYINTAENLIKSPRLITLNGSDLETAKNILQEAIHHGKSIAQDTEAIRSAVQNAIQKLIEAMRNIAIDDISPVIHFAPNMQNSFTVGTNIDLLENISATDKKHRDQNDETLDTSHIQITSQPNFDSNKVGTYQIHYSVADNVGNKTNRSRTITITEADKSLLKQKQNEASNALIHPKLIQNTAVGKISTLISEAQNILDNLHSLPTVIDEKIIQLTEGINQLLYDTEAPTFTDNKQGQTVQIGVGDTFDPSDSIIATDTIAGDVTHTITYEILLSNPESTHATGKRIDQGNHAETKSIATTGNYIIKYYTHDLHNNIATHTRLIQIISQDKTELINKDRELEEFIKKYPLQKEEIQKEYEKLKKDTVNTINNDNATKKRIAEKIQKIDDFIKKHTPKPKKPTESSSAGGYTTNIVLDTTFIPISHPSQNENNTPNDIDIIDFANLPTEDHSSKPITSQKNITPKENNTSGGTIFEVQNTASSYICRDIIQVLQSKDLVVNDIPKDHPFRDDILTIMMFRGVMKNEESQKDMQGVVQNTQNFRPTHSVTRAEFVKMLVRSLNCHYQNLGTHTPFSDVPEDSWYAPYIAFATQNNWINGYKDGTFGPNKPITRAEAAKILANAIKIPVSKKNISSFRDISKNSEFLPYIEALNRAGIMKGRSATQFAPTHHIPRSETARLIYRTFFGGKI